ncbi:MAG: aminopeptidase [Oscillospiraceae bacterium]
MDMKQSAKSVLLSCMGAKTTESVLVVTDDVKLDIGTAIYEAAKEIGCEAQLMVMKERKVSGEEPPAAVASAMKNSDVVVCPTAKSLTHTNARIEAVKNGARVGTMPGITQEMFLKGAITADYDKVIEITAKITELLTQAKTARIEKDGYTLTLNLEGRKGVPSPGVYREKGTSGNIPSGEAYIAPLEDGADGEMMIDGSMVGIGKLESPIFVKLAKGKLTEIRGEGSEKLDILLKNQNNSTIAELGIGTNEKAILCGIILEDEKVYGTVHIAFGTNTSFGGTNKADCHMDGIILKPNLYLDDKAIILKGEFVV